MPDTPYINTTEISLLSGRLGIIQRAVALGGDQWGIVLVVEQSLEGLRAKSEHELTQCLKDIGHSPKSVASLLRRAREVHEQHLRDAAQKSPDAATAREATPVSGSYYHQRL